MQTSFEQAIPLQGSLGQPLQAAMDQHTDGALAPAEDHGDLGDAEIGDHPQQHCLGLVGWQRPDQRQRPVERLAPARTRRRPTGS